MDEQIEVNGSQRSLPDPPTLAALFAELGISLKGTATVLNGDIVEQARYDQTPLAPGDSVEIVRMVGGG